MIFLACITQETMIEFTLKEVVDPKPRFSIREIVIPWLQQGNIPHMFFETDEEIKAVDKMIKKMNEKEKEE